MRHYLLTKIRSTFAKWMISYLVILVIPVIFGTLIYGHAMNNMQQESSYAQEQTLWQAKQNFENQITILYNMAYGVLHSESIGSVADPERSGTYSPKQNILLRDIQRQLVNLAAINEGIESVYPFSARRLRPLRSGMNCVRITLDKVNENTIIKAVEKG